MSHRTATLVAVVVLVLYATLVAIGAVVFCFVAFVIPATSCDRDLVSPQAIDVGPLGDLSLSTDSTHVQDIINLSAFESYEIWDPDGRSVRVEDIRGQKGSLYYSYIITDITLHEEADSARMHFEQICENSWETADLSKFTYGGEEDSQYCISYVKEARASPEGLCRPLGYYHSFVVFRNRNLLTVIAEETSDQSSTRKDDVIKQLAGELAE